MTEVDLDGTKEEVTQKLTELQVSIADVEKALQATTQLLPTQRRGVYRDAFVDWGEGKAQLEAELPVFYKRSRVTVQYSQLTPQLALNVRSWKSRVF